MTLTVESIEKFLLSMRNNIKQPYFFSNNEEYLNTKIPNFRRLMLILVIQLNIIDPELLQNASKNYKDIERKKIKNLEKAIKLGLTELKDNSVFYFKGSNPVPELLSNYFYVTRKSFKSLVKNIIHPLLNLVNSNSDYEWSKIKNKEGFWREFKDDEMMPIGSEISLNLTTGLKMIRLG